MTERSNWDDNFYYGSGSDVLCSLADYLGCSMTARNEKPSPHESSTDTIIGALEIIANLLTDEIEAQAIREAAQRLDKLENELSALRGDK